MPYIPSVIPQGEREQYAKGHMGARAGFGRRPAVLIVDMTRAFTEDRFPLGSSKAGEPCLHAIRRLLDTARPLKVPVIYARYAAFQTDTEWGRWIGIASAGLNSIFHLLTMPAYPFQSMALFAVDVLVVFALISYGGRTDTY